jgi:lipoprotein-anchoring transpeptidase ErfK/SrfK
MREGPVSQAIQIERVVVAVAGAVLALAAALALALSPGADASSVLASRVDVVGAGTLNWSRVTVRAKPSRSARKVKVLKQFRPDYRPQYVLAVSQVKHQTTGKATWYRISLPGRPNGQTGWVPAGAVELWPVKKRLFIDRSERRFEFWHGDKLLRKGRVAVGARGAETPTGLFYVQSKFFPNAEILGAFAFETSAYSRLTDWPGGGVVGVHGTPWPWLLGQAVSHGCVRLHNNDVLWLRSRVPEGTPIKIVP